MSRPTDDHERGASGVDSHGERAVFYGWWVVGAVFVMMTVSSGLGFYGMAVFLQALTSAHGFSVSAVSGATAVMFVVSGVTGLGIADLITRYDPRLTIAGGTLIAATALVAVGRVSELWQLYAAYTLFGLGFSASGLVPGTTIVTRWFTRRRSIALSVASTGLSIGGIVLTPLCVAAIARFGLETATVLMATAYVLGIIPVTAVFLRPDPQSMGLRPDGEASNSGAGESRSTELRSAISTRFYLGVTASYVFVMVAQVGGVAHQFNLVATRSDATTAALALSVLAGSSVVGRLAGGWIVMIVPMRGYTIALAGVQAIALAILGLASTSLELLAGSVLFGITMGNLLMLQPLLLSEAFGVRDYGRIYAVSSLVTTLGVAGGPMLVGIVHDLSGGYTGAFLLAALASLVAMLCLCASGPLYDLSRR